MVAQYHPACAGGDRIAEARVRRAAFALGLIGLAALAPTQIGAGALGFMGATARKILAGPQQNPLEPSGFSQPAERNGELPPGRSYGPEERQFKLLESGTWKKTGSRVHVSGGFHAVYKGYDLYGLELDGDTEDEIYTASGDVKVIGEDSIVVGQQVTVNFRDRTYKTVNSNVQLRPSFLKGKVLDDVYLRGGTSNGSQREMFAIDAHLTTCSYDDPHYELLSDSTDLRPGKRIILRKVTVRLLRHDILRLPFLSIPLDDKTDRYTPEIGQSNDEGYFIKFKYPLFARRTSDLLNARIDYFTKLGLGLGGDYFYESTKARGYLKAYGLVGQSSTFSLDQDHAMKLGSNLEFTLQNNFQRQNYLTAPQNTILNTRAGLRWAQSNGTYTTLSFYRNRNESSSFISTFQTLSLNDSRSINRTLRTSLDLTFSGNSSSFSGGAPVERNQLDVRFIGTQEFRQATAELAYQRSIPIGDTTNFYGAADQTPVVTLRSDGSRLLSKAWGEALPFQAELSVGEYGNAGLNGERLSRGNLNISMSKEDRGYRRFGVSMDGRLQQGIYSDDTAQYVIGYNGTARYSLGRSTGINLRYNYLQAHGYTPLQFDRTGTSNLVSTDLTIEPLRRLTFGAQTGYDFVQEQQQELAWQSVGARMEWRPTDSVQLRGLSTFDTFRHTWSNTRLDLAWRAGGTFVSAGARYDGVRHTWGNVNFYVDGFKMGRLKTSALIAYNGYLRQFEARHFSFIYDLHCAEAILQIIDNPTGFRPGTTIGFFIRLKAFPFNTPFGLGRNGQSFGTGTGRDGF